MYESLAGLSRARKSGCWVVAAVLLAVACLAFPGLAAAGGPRLKVVGNQLIDNRSGQVFVARGVNWPSFEYACKDGYGYSNSANRRTVGPDQWRSRTTARPARCSTETHLRSALR